MKQSNILCIIILAVFMLCCSSDKIAEDSLPCIDVRKNYPVKKIILTDIADVTYVHLNTDDSDYFYKGNSFTYISENSIVICDISSGSILFFSKDGTPKSRFNRYGIGPEDYTSGMIDVFFYDEPADDVYVGANGKRNIQVYSSTGKYKRTLTLPQGIQPNQIVEFDNQSLVVFDKQLMWKKSFRESDLIHKTIDSIYLRISKIDGKIVDYIEIPGNEIDLSVRGSKSRTLTDLKRLTKSTVGVFLCNHESDTVFRYDKDASLTPVFCKTPLVSDLDKKMILNNFIEIGRYQYMSIKTLLSSDEMRGIYDEKIKYYMHDKQTKEIFFQKIILPDYNGRDFHISAKSNKTYNEKETMLCYELDLFQLKQAYKDNRLSGKLKELVATLDEMKDNNVLMFVQFK